MPHDNVKTTEYAAGRWIEIVRSEFLEAPGLRLTRAHVQRLCGLDAEMCTTVLDALTHAQFLRRSADGWYVRADHDLSTRSGIRRYRR